MKKSLVFTILLAAAVLFLYSCSPEPTLLIRKTDNKREPLRQVTMKI